MKIEKILAGITAAQTAEKTAAQKPVIVKEATTSHTSLVKAMTDALASTEKVASASEKSPVQDVMKIAQEMAAAEQEAAVKEAQVLGTALADAAIARINEWNKLAAELAPQITPAPIPAQHTMPQEKLSAEEEYAQGYDDAVNEIHKTAAEEFMKAAVATSILLDGYAAQQR